MKAANNFIFIIRDKTESEKSSLSIPGTGRVKPHTGTVVTVGSLVRDQEIKRAKDKKIMWHPTVGFDIEFEGITYLVLAEHEVIAVV